MAKKRGRPKKVKKPDPTIQFEVRTGKETKAPETIEAPVPELLEAPQVEIIQDRMMRYYKPRTCPHCKATPVVTMMKRGGYALYRCRICGLKWEITP